MYGLVNPEDYRDHVLSLREGMEIERDDLLRRLVEMQFERNAMISAVEHSVFVGTSLKSSYQGMMRRPFVLNSSEMKSKRLKKLMCWRVKLKQPWNMYQSSQQRTLWPMKTKFHGPWLRLKKSLRND